MTRPLPKTRQPVLKKKRKSFAGIPAVTATHGRTRGRTGPAGAGGGEAGGAVGGASPGAAGRKRKTPRKPATRKMAVSSFWTTTVIAQATRKKTHATGSRRIVLLPRFQQAFTMSA